MAFGCTLQIRDRTCVMASACFRRSRAPLFGGSFWFLLSITANNSVFAYDLGEDVSLCWRTNKTAGGEPTRVDCQGVSAEFSYSWPRPLYAQQVYEVHWTLTVPPELNPSTDVDHANLHSCELNVGFCTPFVANTPGLATHSEISTGSFDDDSVFSTTNTLNLPDCGHS